MNLNQSNNERENVIAQAYWSKIEKLTLQLFILRNKEDILSDKINKKESQLNETRVKYEAIKERQERKAAEKMEKEEAMKERQERKAAEKMEKEEAMKERHERKAAEKMEQKEAMKERHERKAAEKMAKEELRQNKKYISTASQLQSVSKLSNETIIRLVNSNDISIENLARVTGCRLQEDYPSGWDIPTFKKRFIQDFCSTNWLKGMQNQSNSIGSVFYRMCPGSTTSTSKITGKMRTIPSFVKVTSNYDASPTYIFDANLYLHF